jgi:hypothetical protein
VPEIAAESVPEPEAIFAEPIPPDVSMPELFAPELDPPRTESRFPVFLTAAESSVFVAGSVDSKLLAPTETDEPTSPDESRDHDPAEPRE